MKRECVKAHQNLDYYAMLERCNLFTISERLQFYSLGTVYKLKRFGGKVAYLVDLFKSNPVKSQSTRSKFSCVVHVHRTKLFENSLGHYSSMLWNSVPFALKDLDDLKLNFYSSVTNWILENRSAEFVKP